MDLQRTALGPLPLLRGGEGPPLLYLGGLLPVAGVDAALPRRSAEFSAAPLASIRSVLYANSRPGLPRGITMREVAAEHAAAIDALADGPVDVLGVSTGGSVAQQLAADHPQLVRRLVLAGTGARLDRRTRRMQAEVATQIRAGHDGRAMISMAVGVFLPTPAPLMRLLAPLGSLLARRLGDLTDLAALIEAEDGFDLAPLDPIQAPTLLVAGARDRFYPRPLLEETQRLIPDCRLEVIPRRGHVTVMSDKRLNEMIRAFLQR